MSGHRYNWNRWRKLLGEIAKSDEDRMQLGAYIAAWLDQHLDATSGELEAWHRESVQQWPQITLAWLALWFRGYAAADPSRRETFLRQLTQGMPETRPAVPSTAIPARTARQVWRRHLKELTPTMEGRVALGTWVAGTLGRSLEESAPVDVEQLLQEGVTHWPQLTREWLLWCLHKFERLSPDSLRILLHWLAEGAPEL